MSKSLYLPALAISAAFAAPGANAGISPNGLSTNGSQLNGSQLNGSQLNGSQLNGSQLNGSQLNGSQLNGTVTQSLPVKAAILPDGLVVPTE